MSPGDEGLRCSSIQHAPGRNDTNFGPAADVAHMSARHAVVGLCSAVELVYLETDRWTGYALQSLLMTERMVSNVAMDHGAGLAEAQAAGRRWIESVEEQFADLLLWGPR
jgi:hypothetical protein